MYNNFKSAYEIKNDYKKRKQKSLTTYTQALILYK